MREADVADERRQAAPVRVRRGRLLQLGPVLLVDAVGQLRDESVALGAALQRLAQRTRIPSPSFRPGLGLGDCGERQQQRDVVARFGCANELQSSHGPAGRAAAHGAGAEAR